MAEQILLSSVSFDGVREKGGFGQPLHALYPQIRAVLVSELGSDMANFLAEPVVDRVRHRIDWYTEGDPNQPPVGLRDLPDEQRQTILAQVRELLDRGREVAERYAASSDPQRMQLSAILTAVLDPLAETEVFLVSDRPVIAHWGFSPDRPWAALGVDGMSTSPYEVAMPNMAIPEGGAAATRRLAATDESSIPPEPAVELALPGSPPELPPKEAVEPPAVALDKPAPHSKLESSPVAEAPSLSKANPSPAVKHPDRALRYVVVGSRYFWSVVGLALLLALGATFWSLNRGFAPSLSGEAAPQESDATLDRALADARQTGQALRRRLEQQWAALAEQRGRCSLPLGTDAVSVPSALSAPTMPSVASVPPAPLMPESPATAPGTPEPAVASPTLAPPVEARVRDTAPPDASPAGSGSPPIISATPEPPAARELLARALEKELSGSPAAAVAPPLTESASEPPIQAEPTQEERQEFANRLSATGAKTGEITVTLLWDGGADLDLVVRCPSGQTLDYLTPQGCGGALDVDANSTRASLSKKPVENIFWPAGQAAPGTYAIAVRYEPRKDEHNLQPAPFQVRVIRNAQEQVFKGTIRPRKVLQITDFTVTER